MRKHGESSFTLIETIIALGLMVVIVLEVSAVQGNAINFSAFERKVTQATWLAKGLLAHLEDKYRFFELRDIKGNIKEEKFPEEMCPTNPIFDCDFKYSITYEEWKLPLLELAAAHAGGDKSMAGMIKDMMKQYLGDEVLKVANVTVSWAEGSRKDFVNIPYLMTAQFRLDKSMEELLQPVGPKDETPTGTDTETEIDPTTGLPKKNGGNGVPPPNIPGGSNPPPGEDTL